VQDDEIRRFRGQLREMNRRMRREVVPVSGLSRTAMQVLAAIERLGEAQPGQLADELRLASSNVAVALRELSESGFVSRERDPADGRRIRLAVTPAGAAATADLRHERTTWFGRAVDAMLTPAEQQTLLAAGDLLQRLADYEPVASRTGAAS
jgi:DNA-binding MarR family transcriptional regulator